MEFGLKLGEILLLKFKHTTDDLHKSYRQQNVPGRRFFLDQLLDLAALYS